MKWNRITTVRILVSGLILLLAILVSCNNNGSRKAEPKDNTEDNISRKVELKTWEDSVAYAVGLNYAIETKSGYSVPIDEVIKKRYKEYFGSDIPSFSFDQLCKKGFEKGKANPQEYISSYAPHILNLLNCETMILEDEAQLTKETDKDRKERITKSMINQYRRLDFILRNHPDVKFIPHRISNFSEKREWALKQDYDDLGASQSDGSVSKPQVDLGNWTKEGNSLVSPKFKNEYDPITVQIILEKDKMTFRFNTKIEKEYEMKILKDGQPDISLDGKVTGKDFIITNKYVIDHAMTYMKHGSCTIQYMFLESGASHWGWLDFRIGDKLTDIKKVYSTLE